MEPNDFMTLTGEVPVAGKINFTKPVIDALSPTSKRQYFYDHKVQGLELVVTPNGTKTFYFKQRINGLSERVKIGRYPAATPSLAKDRAKALQAEVVMGGNPARNALSVREEILFGPAFTEFLDRHAKPMKKSWKQDEGLHDRYLKKWANRRISTIDHNTIQRHHAKIGQENGKYVANRVLALLHTLFVKLKAWGYVKGDNPASGIERFKEMPRQRFLTPDEVTAFLEALKQEPDGTVADLLRIGLFTGVRKSNVMAMRFDEISSLEGEEPLWRIPETKGGLPVEIFLSDEAAEIIRNRRNHSGSCPWVFPGSGSKGHYADPKKAFQRACKEAGIKDATFHTFRHTMASWMTIEGYSLPVIGKALGHRSIRSTQVYAHLTDDPVRAAVSATTAKMTIGKNSLSREGDEDDG